MLLKNAGLLMAGFLFASTTHAASPQNKQSAVQKAAKSLRAELNQLDKKTAQIWNDYLQIDDLLQAKDMSVSMRDLMACRLNLTKQRPELQHPIPSLRGFESLERAVAEIQFTAAQLKAAGRGSDHSPVFCAPAVYESKHAPEGPIPAKIKQTKAAPQKTLGTAPFSLFQIRYWPFSPNKSGQCSPPLAASTAAANAKIADAKVAACRDQGFQKLLTYLSDPPVECKHMVDAKGPHVFNIVVAHYKSSENFKRGSKDASCRLTTSFRSPWTYNRSEQSPPWLPQYRGGYVMWPVEFSSTANPPTCSSPSRMDLVRYCASELSDRQSL